MSDEANNSPERPCEGEERQLCVSCAAPNHPSAHFCIKCGAPLSSYASTGPFESLFAEGAVYREAAPRPRSLVVVLGVWLIFGTLGLAGLVMVWIGRDIGLQYTAFGAIMLALSVVLVWKSTRNYLARPKTDQKQNGASPNGGPAMALGNPGAAEGPPSVSQAIDR